MAWELSLPDQTTLGAIVLEFEQGSEDVVLEGGGSGDVVIVLIGGEGGESPFSLLFALPL